MSKNDRANIRKESDYYSILFYTLFFILGIFIESKFRFGFRFSLYSSILIIMLILLSIIRINLRVGYFGNFIIYTSFFATGVVTMSRENSGFKIIENIKISKEGSKIDRVGKNALEIINLRVLEKKKKGIITAIISGEKKSLDFKIKQVYAKAGVSHLLAASGLHLGYIYSLILVIQFITKLRSGGKFVFSVISLALIWFYAMFAGLSDSILRAAMMSTIAQIAMLISRNSKAVNSLGLSVLLLLSIEPTIIYNLGFQLSVMSTLSILLLHFKLSSLAESFNIYIKVIWQTLSITFAGQVGTIFLTLSTFKHFPTYFMIGNLLEIPLTAVIIIESILLIIFDTVDSIANFISIILSATVYIHYRVAEIIASMPFA